MHACVRTDNMSGTIVGKDLASAKFYASEQEAAIENGNIVTLGGYLDGEREVRKATAPAALTALRDLYLVASPEVIKDKDYFALGDFINEAGSIIRCYRLTSGDIFSVTKEALDGEAKLNYVVEAQASTKMAVKESASVSEGEPDGEGEPTSTATLIGKVVALEDEWIVIEVA